MLYILKQRKKGGGTNVGQKNSACSKKLKFKTWALARYKRECFIQRAHSGSGH